MRVFVGSWNVNGKFPREDLSPWLADGAFDPAQGGGPTPQGTFNLPDVYVVGCVQGVKARRGVGGVGELVTLARVGADALCWR